MKRIRRYRFPTHVAACGLLLGLAVAPLEAGFQCKQELFAGTWIHHGQLSILDREGPDIFPPPGPFSAVGILVFDEQGRATVNRQTGSSSTSVGSTNFLPLVDTQITINPDCTGKMVYTLRDDISPQSPLITVFGYKPGESVFEMALVCANGQRECWFTFTKPEGIFLGIADMRRVDSLDEPLQTKMDTLSGKVDAIMRRLGLIVPPSDQNQSGTQIAPFVTAGPPFGAGTTQ